MSPQLLLIGQRRGRRMAFLAAAALAIGGCASPGASTSTGASTSPAATNALLDEAMGLLQKAEQHTTTWDGPTSGPKAQTGKLVVYVAQDMRNGGVLGVSKGVQEAAAAIGWQLKIIDGLGTVNGRVAAINQAVALKPA